MMNGFSRAIVPTGDGSHTVAIPELGITYHSNRGAIQESMHVFIQAGLAPAFRQFPDGVIHVLEMGFGTGLNAFLTALEAANHQRGIAYSSLELYPLNLEEALALNYAETLGNAELFKAIHEAAWNEPVPVHAHFTLHKQLVRIEQAMLNGPFQVVYYDAFAPDAQPELWTEAIFQKLYSAMAEGGILTTYCSKGIVRRAMAAAGFTVHKIPGPPGKREMVQAFKGASPGSL